MLKQVAEGVLVHVSECIQSNAIVVQGETGVLLIDAGLTSGELASIAGDLEKLGQPVVAGFSTHSHWDHVLWHARFGDAPHYGSARCADEIKAVLSKPGWEADIAGELPEEIAADVPLDNLFGQITGLPVGTIYLPWDGPKVRIIEHDGHAPGHAALLIEDRKVLVAGDMLSDVLVPMPNLAAAEPVKDYLAGLQVLEDAANNADTVIPGHGSVGTGDEIRTRIKIDRAYIEALRDGTTPDDPRISSPKEGWDWVAGIHEWQAKQLARKAGA